MSQGMSGLSEPRKAVGEPSGPARVLFGSAPSRVRDIMTIEAVALGRKDMALLLPWQY